MYAIFNILSDEDKKKLLEVTSHCFEIIGPDEDEDEDGLPNVIGGAAVNVRLPSDKDKFDNQISIYQ